MPTLLDQFPIRPAQRNPRPSDAVGAPAPDFAAQHPFAPTGWAPAMPGDPTAGGAPAVPPTGTSFSSLSFGEQNRLANSGVYEPGSFGDQNNKANLGITAPGTFARENADANGTGFKDPVSGPGVKSSPTYPTVPEVSYNAVNGVGTPAVGPAPARATRTLTQGAALNLPAGPVFDFVGKGGSQPSTLNSQPSRSGQSLALSALLGSYGTPPETSGHTGRRGGEVDPLNALGDTGMVLNAARGLDALRTQTAAEQDLKLLGRAGMIPQPNDTPEVRSNKIAYLDQRIREQATGRTSRAPGSPVYPGATAPAQDAPSIAEMAGLANRITATAGTKPLPGSAGYGKTEVPGVGTIVRDNATGEPVGSGSIIKPPDPKDKAPTEAQVTFDSNLEVAMQKLDELQKVVNQDGTWESSTLGNPKSAAALEQLPYQIAILTAKIVDPATAAREGEVSAAQKYLLPLGFWANKNTALQSIENLRNTFKQYGKSRADAQSKAAPIPAHSTPGPAASSGSLAPGSITPEQAKAELARRRAAKK